MVAFYGVCILIGISSPGIDYYCTNKDGINQASAQHISPSKIGGWVIYDIAKDANGIIQALAAIIMALFTVSLTVLAKSADKTAKKEIRAYISVDIPRGSKVTVGGNRRKQGADIAPVAFFKFMIVNNGSTPAKNIRYREGSKVLGYNERPETDGIKPRKLPDISKGGSIPHYFYSQIIDGQYLDMTQIDLSLLAPMVFGLIEYDDVFGDTWRTEFCAKIDPLGGPAGGFYLLKTDDHNDAT